MSGVLEPLPPALPSRAPYVRSQPPLTACPLPDIDKVMINLKTEEFVLDMNTLQALQQLLQWVGDFVLYLLASLPNQVCPPPHLLQLSSSQKPPLLGPTPPQRPSDGNSQRSWNAQTRKCTSRTFLPIGLPAATRPQLPAGWHVAGHAARADGCHPHLGPAET